MPGAPGSGTRRRCVSADRLKSASMIRTASSTQNRLAALISMSDDLDGRTACRKGADQRPRLQFMVGEIAPQVQFADQVRSCCQALQPLHGRQSGENNDESRLGGPATVPTSM